MNNPLTSWKFHIAVHSIRLQFHYSADCEELDMDYCKLTFTDFEPLRLLFEIHSLNLFNWWSAHGK